MARSRKILTAGAIGVAAFALIGTGAGASFNDAVQVQQEIQSGTMNVTVSSNSPGSWTTSDGKTLTLKATGPRASTFTTGMQGVTVTNNSNIVAKLVSLEVTAPTNNDALANGLRVRIDDVYGSRTTPPLFDGTLAELRNAGTAISTPELAIGATLKANVTFYANDLPNGAQAGVVTPTFKVNFTG